MSMLRVQVRSVVRFSPEWYEARNEGYCECTILVRRPDDYDTARPARGWVEVSHMVKTDREAASHERPRTA
jgi:hypothetical protein